MSSQSPEVSERSPRPGEGESTSPLALLARHPLSAYYLLMGSALLLLLLGLIMVMWKPGIALWLMKSVYDY